MKKSLLIFILLAFISCEKEKETTVTEKKKVTKTTNFDPIGKDTLHIIGNSIWVRKTPKTGKVVFKLNDNTTCEVLEKGIKDTIRQNIDFWYKIKTDNQVGWVFGSQTSKSQKLFLLDDFDPFLKDFLQTAFYGKNIDSLLRYKSPIIYKYVHKKIGFTRFYNPGTTCIPQKYNKHNYRSENQLNLDLPFFNEKEFKDGFCVESTSNDGVYYHAINQLPKYPVFLKDDYVMKSILLPKKYKNAPIKKINILYKKWIIKQLYFIKAEGKWWLVLSNDCDCSA